MSLLTARWAVHPWLTGLEVAGAAVAAIEGVLLAHVLLGWAWGVVTHNPDAMSEVRFVFMTGEDAKFGAGLIAVLALLPLGLLLLLGGGVGTGWAAYVGTPLRPYVEAVSGGAVLLVAAVVLFFSGRVLGGGLLPH